MQFPEAFRKTSLFLISLSIILLSCSAPLDNSPSEDIVQSDAEQLIEPTAVSPSPSPTADWILPTPIATPYFDKNRLVLYSFRFNSGLSAYSIPVDFGDIVLSPYNSYEVVNIPETPTNTGPGQAFALAFSSYSERAAYWIIGQPGRLWISDLDLSEQSLLYEDKDLLYPDQLDLYGSIQLEWIFGDKYLWLTVPNRAELNLIYSEELGLIMPFPFDCDILAISPQTSLPSLWCPMATENEYWVLEANGDWWQSEKLPGAILIQEGNDIPLEWEWTPAGTLIYFDHTRQQDQLTIYQDGLVRHLPIDSFSKLSEEGSIPSHLWSSVYPTIRHFGVESSHILVHGIPVEKDFCPPTIFINKLYEPAPCWMVIDIQSGEIVWGLNDLVRDERLGIPADNISVLDFRVPILSSDGRFLAISETNFNRHTYVVDLLSGEVVIWFRFVDEDYLFANSD